MKGKYEIVSPTLKLVDIPRIFLSFIFSCLVITNVEQLIAQNPQIRHSISKLTKGYDTWIYLNLNSRNCNFWAILSDSGPLNSSMAHQSETSWWTNQSKSGQYFVPLIGTWFPIADWPLSERRGKASPCAQIMQINGVRGNVYFGVVPGMK